jgi:hypothetical protein
MATPPAAPQIPGFRELVGPPGTSLSGPLGPVFQSILVVNTPAFGVEAADARDAAISISRRFVSGSSEVAIRDLVINVYDDAALTTLSASATLSLVPAGTGTVITGTGTNSMVVTTAVSGASAKFDLRVSEAGAGTRYVTYTFRDPGTNNLGVVPSIGPVSAIVFA